MLDRSRNRHIFIIFLKSVKIKVYLWERFYVTQRCSHKQFLLCKINKQVLLLFFQMLLKTSLTLSYLCLDIKTLTKLLTLANRKNIWNCSSQRFYRLPSVSSATDGIQASFYFYILLWNFSSLPLFSKPLLFIFYDMIRSFISFLRGRGFVIS